MSAQPCTSFFSRSFLRFWRATTKCVRLSSSCCLQMKNLYLSPGTVTFSPNRPLRRTTICSRLDRVSSGRTITALRASSFSELMASSAMWVGMLTALSSLSYHSDTEMLVPLNMGTRAKAAPNGAIMVSALPSIPAANRGISCLLPPSVG